MWFCGPPEKDSNKNKFDGAYPSGFMKNVKQGFHKYYPKNTDDILHVCAGRIPASEGIRLDVDECYDPDYVGNCHSSNKSVRLSSDSDTSGGVSSSKYCLILCSNLSE